MDEEPGDKREILLHVDYRKPKKKREKKNHMPIIRRFGGYEVIGMVVNSMVGFELRQCKSCVIDMPLSIVIAEEQDVCILAGMLVSTHARSMSRTFSLHHQVESRPTHRIRRKSAGVRNVRLAGSIMNEVWFQMSQPRDISREGNYKDN